MTRLLLALPALAFLQACLLYQTAKPAPLPEGAREHLHLTYRHGRGFDRFRHRLNVFVPAGEGPHPVLVFAHGGGWRAGDPNGTYGVYRRLGRRLAARGYVAVIPGYRLAPDHKHPDQVRDVAAAIAWTLEHAHSFGGDPGAVFAMGHSAGAQLVALAACDPRWLREVGAEPGQLAGVIGISGPYDVADLAKEAPRMVRAAFGDDASKWPEANPATHLAVRAPPFLIAVAEHDPEMLRRQGRAFASALRESGATVEEKTIADRGHYTIVVELADDTDTLAFAIESFVHRRSSVRGALRGPP